MSSSRPDFEPEIFLPDVREQEQAANGVVGAKYRARVQKAGERIVKDGWTSIFDRTIEMLSAAKRSEPSIDTGFVLFLMQHCAQAFATPVTDNDGNMLLRDDAILHRLRRVGCRTYLKQSDMAEAYGCSPSTAHRQIQAMKRTGIIVNQGHGWYEFDANLCWRGEFKIQRAYREIQKVHDGITFTDGKTTIVTDGMDNDEHPDHTPEQVEEEEQDQ